MNGNPQLKAELQIVPDEIWINVMSGAGGTRQPKDVRFTLVITNGSRTDYSAENPDSGVFRFWVEEAGSEIWHSPEQVLQVITPVSIPAGQSKQESVVWHIDDARKLARGTLTAFGEFVPARLRAQGNITVDEAQ
jgi:hypothetical protein